MTQDAARWRMAGLLALAYFTFGIAVASLAPVVDLIIDDLGMTSAQMGLVLGMWQLVFVGAAPPAGRAIDRFGPRATIAFGITFILASMVLRGLAVDFVTLLLAVALFGIGAPFIASGLPKVVAQWFKGNERGPATGIYVVGRDIGAVLALSTAGSLVISLTGSWRGMSALFGGIIFVGLVTWLVFARDAAPGQPRSADVARERVRYVDLLRLRNVQIVLVLGFSIFLLNHSLGSWLPTLLQERGFSIEASGRWTALGLAAAMITNFAVPSLARTGSRRFVLTGMLAASAATTLGLAMASGSLLLVFVITGSMVRMPTLQVLTLVLMETPEIGERRLGMAAGIFFAVAEVGGFAGPLVMGVVRDVTDSLSGGVYALAGLIAVLTAIPLLLRER